MTMFDQITALATIKRISAAEVIRHSIDAYLKQRLKDPELSAKIDTAMRRHHAKLAVLTGGPPAHLTTAPPPRPRAHDEKSVSLRITDRDLDQLTSFALLDDTSVADQLRSAVTDYIENCRNDARLQEEIEESRETHRQILAALA
ncbi:hypothetical protein [Mycolicibacterium lacusdiani]|uniref:hypothetical protein n=1 Tax=Mycolicibacterium lacusdiani TaxID=2895283 RepID=UPI001F1F3155|nr:hypothetical protein [Mycolicibacterium lacusdiani]